MIPAVLSATDEIRAHLFEHGWAVTRVVDESTAFQLRDKLIADIAGIGDSEFIPRTLGGMIKTHKLGMSRTAHELRKLARPVFYNILQGETDAFLTFPPPTTEDELSCNPDALFVSTGEPARFPVGVELPDPNMWWHVDTEVHAGFLQGSFVLDNPEGSEQFSVLDGSHRHFDLLDISDPGSDFHLLSKSDFARMNFCPVVNLRIPAGCLVVWYSATVHTVKPPDPDVYHAPRVQTYICFGTTAHLDEIVVSRMKLVKTLAVLLGGSCRHHPYPCEVTWQQGYEGMRRDFVPPEELPACIFGSSPSDFTDDDLSVYGLTHQDVLDGVEYWTHNWKRKMDVWTRWISRL